MRSILLSMLAATIVAGSLGAAEPAQLKTQKQKVSYLIGRNIGGSMANDGIDVDVDALAAGFRAALAKQPSLLSPQESQAVMQAFQEEMRSKQEAMSKVAAKDGEAFLAANKKKAGIKVTESGLQYKSLKAGTGKTPKPGDNVTTHYTGTLIDGSKFDSSVDRGQPATFPVTGVIPGWTEALQLMKEGDKWQLFIPYQLAYGERGSPPKIPPYAALIFEIELIKVN